MKLSNRKLVHSMQGEDIKLLLTELRQLGYDIPNEEFQESIFLGGTQQAVIEFQTAEGLEPTGVVDEVTAALINFRVEARTDQAEPEQPSGSYLVMGQIRLPTGEPLLEGIVRAFDRDLLDEQPLREYVLQPSDQGRYAIPYTAEQFRWAEKKSADLIVRAYDSGNNEIATSEVIYNAQRVETVNLGGELSEFEQFLRELEPLLQGIPLAELQENEDVQQITFLHKETDISRQNLIFLVQAHRLGNQTDLYPEVFYGLFRQNLPTSLPELLARSEEHRHALETSLENNLIPAWIGEQLEAILQQLQELELPSEREELFQLEEYSDRTLNELRELASDESIENELRDQIQKLYQTLVEKAQFQLNEQDQPIELGELLQPDIPLKENPLVQAELQRSRFYHLGEIANLREPQLLAVLKQSPTLATLDDTTLKSLVEARTLHETQAKNLGLTANLYRLFDENMHLTATIKLRDNITQSPGGRVERLADLIALETEDWENILTEADITPPQELSVADYAAVLSKRIETLYPSNTLVARLLPKEPEFLAVEEGLDRLQPLFERNEETIFAADSFDSLNVEGIEPDQVTTLHESYTQLQQFAQTYPGLRIHELLDLEISTGEKIVLLNERIQLLPRFQAQNPELEFLRLDYAPDSTDLEDLNFSDFEPEEQEMVLYTLKGYQRIHSLTKDVNHTKHLAEKGYHSAVSILSDGRETFVEKIKKPQIGLQDNLGNAYYDNALDTVGSTTALIGAFLDLNQGGINWMPQVDNVTPAIGDYLKKFNGFKEFFGSQDYCQCKHCQSIFSPAAYFVDLMYFVEQHILEHKDSPLKGRPENALHLYKRRPDLWELPLTCENTHTFISYLTIINEVLENYLAPHKDLADRSSVELEVYGQQLYKINPQAPHTVASFQQPFLLPLAELNTYLAHFDKTQGDIATLLEGDRAASSDPSEAATAQAAIARTHLQLSKREYNLIITQVPHLNFFITLYGLPFQVETGSNNVAFWDPTLTSGTKEYRESKNNAQLLLKSMGLKRKELGDLIATQFVSANGTEPLQIRGEKRSSESIQNDIERIYGLKLTSLDRMHRFTRLWRQLTWTITELDLVLSHLSGTSVTHITAPTLYQLTTLLGIQKRFQLSVEELCPIWSNLPERTVAEDKPSLCDRLFNLREFVLIDGEFPKSETFLHPAFQATGPSPTSKVQHRLHRLLAGLRCSDADLYLLIDNLSQHLSPPNQPDKAFTLSVENLSLLYRHARLAEYLNLKISELFQLIGFVRAIADNHIKNLADCVALLAFYDWWKTTDYSLDDLGLIAQGTVQNPKAYPDEKAIAPNILKAVKADKSLLFTDTVFAFLKGVTEDQSRAIVATNAGWIEEANAKWTEEVTSDKTLYWLSDKFDPNASELTFSDTLFTYLGVNKAQSKAIVAANSTIIEALLGGTAYKLSNRFDPKTSMPTIPSKIPVAEAEAKSLLLAYHAAAKAGAQELLLTYHATEVIPTKLANKLSMPVDKMKQMIELVGFNLAEQKFIQELHSASSTRLSQLIKVVVRLSILFKHKVFDAAALKFIQNNRAIFGISNFNSISIENIQTLALYQKFLSKVKNQENTPKETIEKDVQALQNILQKFDTTTGKFAISNPGDRVNLARILDAELSLTITLQPNVTLPKTALDALDKLSRCAELAKYLGVSGEALKLAIAEGSDEYDELSQASNAILSAFRSKYADEKDWEDKIEPFRDKINSRKRDALTDFLIHAIHPEFERLNDLYHQFLIDVELGSCARTSRLAAAISSVQLYVHRVLMNLEQNREGSILVTLQEKVLDEWVWRKNYRVWEANRKVFLYPENYLEPELRDNKSPLFEELETELLQQQINPDTVLAAYGKYMKGFLEVGQLKIAGAYHDKDWDSHTDILHLFGVTRSDPPIYYYRTVENAHFGEREDTPKERAISWSPWRKIDVQISARKVSPIVYKGKLYLFWIKITTLPQVDFKESTSIFNGYKHTITTKFTSLHLDNTWTPPQIISERVIAPDFGLLSSSFRHTKPVDGYTLTGYSFEQVFLENLNDKKLIMSYWGSAREIDFSRLNCEKGYNFSHIDKRISRSDQSKLFTLYKIENALCTTNATISYYLKKIFERKCKHHLASDILNRFLGSSGSLHIVAGDLKEDDEISLINGSINDIIIDSNLDLIFIQGSTQDGFLFKRIGTTRVEEITKQLTSLDVDGLLNTQLQESTLKEPKLPIRPVGKNNYIFNASNAKKKSSRSIFKGPYSVYYREIYFHTPFLIANHLNSQQKFAEAQRWYHYIFDPTASENGNTTSADPKRNWRYIEFRRHDVESLRTQLTDGKTIALYKKDPFNPHAIARLRLSAYQKCIVMKYIDNLLDWGDHLFAQDSRESINEATLLYILAADILGERPAELGECIQEQPKTRTYRNIKPLLKKSENSEFLLEMENFVRKPSHTGANQLTYDYTLSDTFVGMLAEETLSLASPSREVLATEETSSATVEHDATEKGLFQPNSWKRNVLELKEFQTVPGFGMIKDPKAMASFGMGLMRQINPGLSIPENKEQLNPVFCIPENKELKRYWDRVEDRLYKIRNCMNISGVRRQLSLFAPEIDPRLLVRAKAAGLSLEDVLNSISGDLPPYRFAYLIEKAKEYASVVQGFGAALLGALEKKDVEELTLLLTVHQDKTLKMSTVMREKEKEAAEKAIKSLKKRIETIKYLKKYYQFLQQNEEKEQSKPETQGQGQAQVEKPVQIDKTAINLQKTALDSEALRFASITLSRTFQFTSHILDKAAAVAHLVPEAGAPTSLKFGGKQLGHSLGEASLVLRGMSLLSEFVADGSSFTTDDMRRKQGWHHQEIMADYELEQLKKDLEAAKIRKEIAEQSLEIHKEEIKQQKEVYEFYTGKHPFINRFSTLGLYTWLSTALQRLYREAYNSAYSMAKLAEQAYRFERSDDSGELLGSNYWEASRAGLLAGERLLIDLQNLERRFLETDYRSLEIDQSFSLTQIDPAALIKLKQEGSCEFEIPEIYFDLFYPGHYRRKIKSARISIPCITGPYTNVSATLTLLESKLRNESKVKDEYLKDVPRSRSVSIATSNAQNDAGVFELSFRDERYMPFEGAGAISKWKLSLPKHFRQFDYQSINDVILHISYTAEEDGALREKVEGKTADVESAILNVIKKKNSLRRVFSLRQEFSREFHQLLHSPKDTEVKIKLTDKHFPIFLQAYLNPPNKLSFDKALLVLSTAKGVKVNQFKLKINNQQPPNTQQFTVAPKMGDLPSTNITSIVSSAIPSELSLTVLEPDELKPIPPVPGDPSAIDSEKLFDIFLYLEYSVIRIQR